MHFNQIVYFSIDNEQKKKISSKWNRIKSRRSFRFLGFLLSKFNRFERNRIEVKCKSLFAFKWNKSLWKYFSFLFDCIRIISSRQMRCLEPSKIIHSMRIDCITANDSLPSLNFHFHLIWLWAFFRSLWATEPFANQNSYRLNRIHFVSFADNDAQRAKPSAAIGNLMDYIFCRKWKTVSCHWARAYATVSPNTIFILYLVYLNIISFVASCRIEMHQSVATVGWECVSGVRFFRSFFCRM